MWNINKEKELERKWGLVRQFLVLGAHQGLSRTWMHPTYFWFATNEHLRKYFALSYICYQFPELIYLSFMFLGKNVKTFLFMMKIVLTRLLSLAGQFCFGFAVMMTKEDEKNSSADAKVQVCQVHLMEMEIYRKIQKNMRPAYQPHHIHSRIN